MTVNLHQLDRIQDYDRAIAALDGFVEELVIEFITSVEGQVYLQAQPTTREYIGSWIDHLLYFGYVYESVTLPKMTVGNVDAIVTQIFPHQISLLALEDADTIIPELTAFWQFLQREYQHSQAPKIIEFLKQLQPRLTKIINDLNNSGSSRVDSFDNSAVPEATLLSQQRLEIETVLQELASEILAEFPLEIPAAKELQQLVDTTQKPVPQMPQCEQVVRQPQITKIPGAILQDFQILDCIADEEPADLQFGIQPVLPAYFPQWQKIIQLPKVEFEPGVYVFKVSWHQIWRRIAISSDLTLWDLSQLILRSVDFSCDRLDMFSYKNQLGQTIQVVHPYLDGSLSTDELKIADLALEVGSTLEYLFDFGDNWEFQLQLEEIQPDICPDYSKIIASKGKAPEQYPNWEEY